MVAGLGRQRVRRLADLIQFGVSALDQLLDRLVRRNRHDQAVRRWRAVRHSLAVQAGHGPADLRGGPSCASGQLVDGGTAVPEQCEVGRLLGGGESGGFKQGMGLPSCGECGTGGQFGGGRCGWSDGGAPGPGRIYAAK